MTCTYVRAHARARAQTEAEEASRYIGASEYHERDLKTEDVHGVVHEVRGGGSSGVHFNRVCRLTGMCRPLGEKYDFSGAELCLTGRKARENFRNAPAEYESTVTGCS